MAGAPAARVKRCVLDSYVAFGWRLTPVFRLGVPAEDERVLLVQHHSFHSSLSSKPHHRVHNTIERTQSFATAFGQTLSLSLMTFVGL